jgi:hypothetical protein
MKPEKTVKIVSESGDSINIPLSTEGEREAAMLIIDGVRYHFERITQEQLVSEYRVDDDPDYQPQTDAGGYCYVLAPFAK